jgi:hypothetical protein
MAVPYVRPARLAAMLSGLAVAAVAVLCFAPPATAAATATATAASSGGGLAITVRADDPLTPAVVLTNQGGTACQVVTSPLGTVGVTALTQSGTPVTPISTDPSFPDGLDVYLAAQLRTLDPGQSVTVPLSMAGLGSTGHALQTITWSSLGSLGALYPIRSGTPIQLSVSYAPPLLAVTGGAPLCAAAASAPAAAEPASRSTTLPIAIGAAALVLLITVILVLLLARSRRRTARVAAGTVAILLAALAMQVGASRPAAATISVDPSLSGAYGPCGSTLTGPGGDPAGILPSLNNPSANVRIVPANGDQTHEISVAGQIIIFWNQNDRHAYTGGGNADPCTSLYHEMNHASDDLHGGQDHSECVTSAGPSGLPVNEVNATRAQNKLRVTLGLPPRKTYGDTPLPAGPCLPKDQQPKPKPNCTGKGCGDSNGDPHLTTFDGLRYDFQAAGEFIAARDSADPAGFQIQLRQQPIPGSLTVSVNTGIALSVAGDRVEVALQRPGMSLLVNGSPATVTAKTLPHHGTIAIDDTGTLTVSWPDGSRAMIRAIGIWGLHLTTQPAPARAGTLTGLLGDFNGSHGNDLRTPAGTTLAQPPTFAALYPGFADAWRINQATSLFTYEAGTSTATYTDRSFPHRPAAVANAPQAAAAAALCRRLGITDPQTLADCTLDVALTGQADFALAALATQRALASPTSPGPTTSGTLASGTLEATMRIATADSTDKLTFSGTAGQRVFVDILRSTLPDQCGLIYLAEPDGTTIASSCATKGTGYLDGTLLPVTGKYTLILRPDTGAGEVHLRLIFSTDPHRTLTANGSPVPITIGTPGQVASLTFTGTAGQRVFVEAGDSTLPAQCGVPSLRAPDGTAIAEGCLRGAAGNVDGTLLKVTGQYTVLVDPAERQTGELTLRLITSQDRHASTTIGGAPVTATIDTPGQEAFVTFTGTAGQNVSVAVSSTTLPAACGVPELLAPDGSTLASGCVGSGGGGDGIDLVTLPVDGTFTVLIDPADDLIGQLTFTVRRS